MRVTTLPNDDQGCGWIAILPERAPARRLRGDEQADWVILGGGFTGLAAAHQLAAHRPDDRILLIDAQRTGEGASARNSGFVVGTSRQTDSGALSDPDTYRAVNRLNQHGIDILTRQVERFGIDCQWRSVGKYHCAADPGNVAAIEDYAAWLQRDGKSYRLLGRAELEKELGTGYYRAGLYSPDCVLVQPAALARGLAEALPENVIVYEDCPVTAIDHGAPHRLTCPSGSVRTSHLLVCANAFLPSLGLLRNRLAPLVLTASLTRPLSVAEHQAIGSPSDWGVLSEHPMGATVRFTLDRRIMIRNTAEYSGRLYMDEGEIADCRRIHERALRARFPDLDSVDFVHSWAGAIAVSRNGSTYFGRPADKVYASAGYNGSGVARGTALGALLADLAVGATSDRLDDALSLPMPALNPPRPFLDFGVRWALWRKSRGLGRDK